MIKRLIPATAIALLVGFTLAVNLGQKDVSATVPGTNTLITTKYNNTSAATGGSDSGYGSYLSANGKYVAFHSNATNIMSAGGAGIFLKNLSTNTVLRVNMSTSGVVANADSTLYGISATGRYVIFTSTASNLIDGNTISTSNAQLYLRDTVANSTSILTLNSSGTPANGWVSGFGVSSDGRFILLGTNSTNFDPAATGGADNLYMIDRSLNSVTILNRDSNGSFANSTGTYPMYAGMSCDGSIIAFQESNLVVGEPTRNWHDIYLLDRRAGTKLTNITASGDYPSIEPTVSCNGDYVGFASSADNLDSTASFTKDVNKYHPHIYDRVNQATYIADRSSSTGAVSNGGCWGTGHYSCITVSDTGLGLFSLNQSSLTGVTGQQVYMRDINAGTTELLSKNSIGTVANDMSTWPSISSDGRKAAFYSGSTNLVSNTDTNNAMDVFTSLTGY